MSEQLLTAEDKDTIRKGVQAMEEGKIILGETLFDWFRAEYVRDIWEARLAEAQAEMAGMRERLEKWAAKLWPHHKIEPGHESELCSCCRFWVALSAHDTVGK